ncbi:type IV secretory system conjugative DNA transfer family protein [Exiguobacterium antarcticum]|uniref:Type IV secretory system conjugative DNA transfer family protein n=1 Tax=Exiguobacterium antarcticum TaxID=132920 RepID=A0ABT6R5E2_9BACL|nr:type IV secretory system conjugative DNA transfer family protein [Exiguobacterium antarcticum]MDI3236175.1 type IV secretory system conjugative DNA transfer family protein [Exiguobacterium antarcticum]
MAKKTESALKVMSKRLVSSVFIGGALGYAATTLFHSYKIEKEFLDVFLGFKDNYEWFLVQKEPIQYGAYLLSGIGFLFTFFSTKKKKEGYEDASKHGVYGNAVFSSLNELEEYGFTPSPSRKVKTKWSDDPFKTLQVPEGIILGREEQDLVILHNESKLDNRNVLIVGSPGSSKGQAFVIPNLLNNYSSSMVVTDPKGELYEQTADIKRDQGYQVHQVDFMELVGSKYNPLDYVDDDMSAKKVADSISRNSSKDGKEDFFFSTARDLLTGLILYSKYLNPEASMFDVKKAFNDISDTDLGPQRLQDIIENIGDKHPAYQFLADAASQSGNTRASIMSSFAQQTGIFSMKKVADFTSGSNFKFHDLQEQKTIIYVKIPVTDNPVAALTATFFDQLFTVLYAIGNQHKSILPIPTICMLDEFANLGKLNNYDNILSTCRGYRLSLITIIQDFAQLEEKYSKEQRRTFANNHDTTLFLRTKDTETAKYFEELGGDTTVKFTTKSKSSSNDFAYYVGLSNKSNASSPSESEQYQKKALISQSELLNMQGDTCYVFTASRVLKLQKAFQSVIYSGFITASKKSSNGHFEYVYPKNRVKYIEKMGFNKDVSSSKTSINSIKKKMVREKELPNEEKVKENTVAEKEVIISKLEHKEQDTVPVQESAASTLMENEKIENEDYTDLLFGMVIKEIEKPVKVASRSNQSQKNTKGTKEKEDSEEVENEATAFEPVKEAYMLTESDPEIISELDKLFGEKQLVTNLVQEISQNQKEIEKMKELSECASIMQGISAIMVEESTTFEDDDENQDQDEEKKEFPM